MEKEQNTNSDKQNKEAEDKINEEQNNDAQTDNSIDSKDDKKEIKELTPEERIVELEDKVARTFAEMENQRRRFEKEKDDAFDYGGFSFAKEALNLIDNLERSKQILESDEALKGTEALKKTLEHFEIISKDMISIFSKNEITPISFSPSSVKATTEGVVLAPSAFSKTFGWLPSMIDTHEFVVPKSIPIILLII